MELNGKVALVTGGSRGIGRAVACELARVGARVIVNYHEHEGEAAKTQAAVERAGGEAHPIHADVTKRDEVEAMVAQVKERFGHVYALVNNAGITRDRTLRKMDYAEWDDVLNVNLTGVFNCTKAAAPQMTEAGEGRIVNISSVIGYTGAFGQTNYAAAKAGILGLTKSCALELARYGVTVNAICPGYIQTSMLAAVPEAVQADILKRIPVGRFGQPEEVANTIRFLVTEGAYITGQAFHVNGGLYM